MTVTDITALQSIYPGSSNSNKNKNVFKLSVVLKGNKILNLKFISQLLNAQQRKYYNCVTDITYFRCIEIMTTSPLF